MIEPGTLTQLKPVVQQFVTTKKPAELFSHWNPIPGGEYEIKKFNYPRNPYIYTKIKKVGTSADDSNVQTIIEERDSSYWEGGKQRKGKRQTKKNRKRQTKKNRKRQTKKNRKRQTKR